MRDKSFKIEKQIIDIVLSLIYANDNQKNADAENIFFWQMIHFTLVVYFLSTFMKFLA